MGADIDETLDDLIGQSLRSTAYADVSYRIEKKLGVGSMGVAFLASRLSQAGQIPVVIKVMRPDFFRAASETALLAITKESVALGRLNESVPACHFVVRFIETSSVPVVLFGTALELPWLATEYVHGGTLLERVTVSMREVGRAFEPGRAALCLEALANGLDAIHGVNVIHRDIKPDNVLCCGTGADEVFKIVDFGVARPVGLQQTFSQGSLGTPGFAAPEQIIMHHDKLGAAADVFSLASTMFSVLTGECLFPGESPLEMVQHAREPSRRGIRDCPGLSDALRAEPAACDTIDAVIAHATQSEPHARPQRASIFAAGMMPALRRDDNRGTGVVPETVRRPITLYAESGVSVDGGWTWRVRHAVGDARAVSSVAWDGDGTCLAATDRGLSYWDGLCWQATDLGGNWEHFPRVVRRLSPGVWLVGGELGMLAYCSSSRSPMMVNVPDNSIRFDAATGEPDDLAVLLGCGSSGWPTLYCICGNRWVKELVLHDCQFVPALARFDDARWIVGGRNADGQAFVGLYSPLRWELTTLATPNVRALLAASAVPELRSAILVGAEGCTVRVTEAGVHESFVPGAPDLSAVVLDIGQRAYAASLGKIWMNESGSSEWVPIWEDAEWSVPLVSLYADANRIVAVAADGGVLEGVTA
ncbi:MAG: serine/threonine protein kinase [Polyangiaceae bacterium]|nr:serine/threonine protein kinase [Polyangiaceae bacterium]